MIIVRKALELWLAPIIFLVATLSTQASEISVSNASPKQGETIELIAIESADAAAPPSVTFNGETYRLFPKSQQADGATQYAVLLGIPADLKPGKYKIFVGADKLDLTVKAGKFPIQYLTLPKSKDNFLMSPGEKEGVAAAKATLSDKRMWSGAFVTPSKFPMSSQFGQRRVVNGRLLDDYFHSGLDFRASAGSPIVSCAPGTVVLTGKNWRLHGNTVGVDHGQGVISLYIHMKTIAVKPGDQVAAGQKLGTVGATGRASGPHLHWSLYVNRNATNPRQWLARAF